jgi:hypothetical protein
MYMFAFGVLALSFVHRWARTFVASDGVDPGVPGASEGQTITTSMAK